MVFLSLQRTRCVWLGRSKVSRACSTHKSESPSVCEWVLEEKCAEAQCAVHTFKRKKNKEKNASCNSKQISQAWSQEVCHTGWSGQEIIICSALEEGKPEEKGIRRDWPEDRAPSHIFLQSLRQRWVSIMKSKNLISAVCLSTAKVCSTGLREVSTERHASYLSYSDGRHGCIVGSKISQ